MHDPEGDAGLPFQLGELREETRLRRTGIGDVDWEFFDDYRRRF
jgi:hypothetical protein